MGILPAYGIYARHVRGLRLDKISVKFKVTDERPAVVLDDVADSQVLALTASTAPGIPAIVEVTDTRKREPDQEYVKGTPYKTTTASNVTVSSALRIEKVVVDRPAPGTPPDSLYSFPTAPSASYPYAYAVSDDKYPRPLTVYRPVFDFIAARNIHAGSPVQFTVTANTPVADAKLSYSADHLPAGASFDASTRTFSWTPGQLQTGVHTVTFTVKDGVLPETVSAKITVLPPAKP